MKPTLEQINYLYPKGVTWYVWKHYYSGKLRAQFRPIGAKPYSPGKAWTLVRTEPHDPKLCKRRLLSRLFADI